LNTPITEALPTLEIIILYLSLNYILNNLGVDKFFPANNILIISTLYLFLFHFKKQSRTVLFLKVNSLKGSFYYIATFTIISIAGLTAWFLNQEGNAYTGFIPNVSIFLLIPMGFAFAIINAFYEESLFRSILLSDFSGQVGMYSAILLQAIWFSFLHYQSGFPSGLIGKILTFVFGSMMGYLVKRTKSILIPFVIHFLADLSIFLLVILRMKNVL